MPDDMPDDQPQPDQSQPDQAETELDQAEIDQRLKEREERLDPDNRPENDEVDNTERDFDTEKGMFTDSEGYDEAPAPFPPPGQGEV